MLISFFLMITISTSLTVSSQSSPRFHVEARLPFKNCEIDYSAAVMLRITKKSCDLGEDCLEINYHNN